MFPGAADDLPHSWRAAPTVRNTYPPTKMALFLLEPRWTEGAQSPQNSPKVTVLTISLRRDNMQPAAALKQEPLVYESDWKPWFAWHPVRLYMTGRIAWLRR